MEVECVRRYRTRGWNEGREAFGVMDNVYKITSFTSSFPGFSSVTRPNLTAQLLSG